MELVQRMEEFIREKYYAELLKAAKEDGTFAIDFSELDRFDPITSDQLLEAPKMVLESMQKSVESFGLGEKISVRVRNLPESRNIRIRSLRAKHLNRLWCIDAIIKSASEVKPQIYEATFVCPECGTKISVPQEGNLLQKAFACQCGRRGDFGDPVEKKMFDVRWLTGVEPFEITTGEQPGEIRIILKEDLTTPKMQKKTDPGARLRIVGMLIESPKHIKGRLSTKMDIFFEALHVETKDIEFEDMDITPEDEMRIKELASDPKIYERLKMSIAPGIYGFDEIKESIALQLFGGIKHTLPDGNTIRGNIHILLTGDPGIGKSVISSSKILHNSNDKVEYTKIGKLVDNIISEQEIVNKEVEIGLNTSGIRVLSLNPVTYEPEWRHVTAFIRHKSPEKLVKIRTASGREVVATKDHSFISMGKNGEIISIEGRDVNCDMFFPVLLNTHKEMIKSIGIEQKIRTNVRKISDKIETDWNFGFFIGMFLAEGSLSRGCVYIDSYNTESKYIIGRFLGKIGLKPNLGKKRLFVSSRNLVKFLEKECYNSEKIGSGKGSGAGRKCIPSFCFFSPKEFIFGIISGMFSGDGYFQSTIPKKGRRKVPNFRIGYATISNDLAIGLVELMSSVGIFSTIHEKRYTYKGFQKTCFEVMVIGDYISRLLKDIKIVGKKPRTERISEKDSFDCLPCTSLLYDIVRDLGYSKKFAENAEKRRAFAAMMRTVRSRGKIGRRRLGRIYSMLLDECKKQGNKDIMKKLEILDKIIKSDIVWDRVKEKEEIESKEKYVYDLSINGNETFVVNNLVVHNTQFLKLISNIVPRGKYVSGSGVTGAGLTATVRKDEILGGWVLEAGALILANKGVISIDEFDKMGKDDQIAMHEGMSIETVSIAKASIVATLPAETAVLAGANPKFGRFDPYMPIADQITIPETLLSRFDLKFALKDKPDRVQDERLAEHIILSRTKPELVEPAIDISLLRKYIAYSKQINSMELIDETAQKLKEFYVDMRNRYTGEDSNTISITLRQYEALIRMAEASAKIRLDTKIRVEDADRAINLMKYSLSQLGYDYETGRIDIDRVEGGVPAGKRKKIHQVLEIIESLQKTMKEVPVEDMKAAAEEQGIDNIDEIIEKLKNEGTLFEPKVGFIKKLR